MPESVVAPEIMELAKKSVEGDRPTATQKCAVCGAMSLPSSSPHANDESLCWVCRRLKISAWRDADQQLSAQE